MPRVPTARERGLGQQTVTEPAEQGSTAIRTSVEAFGGGAARASQAQGRAIQRGGEQLAGLSNVLQQRAAEMKEENDAAAAMEAFSSASDALREDLYDPQNGVFAQRGKNAQGADERMAQRFRELEREYGKNLRNDAQQRAFRDMLEKQRDSTLNSVARHEAQEFRSYTQNAAESVVNTAIDNSVGAYTNSDLVQDNLETAEAAIRVANRGQDEAVVQEKIGAMRSSVRSAIVRRMAKDSPEAARRYFDEHKDEIGAEQQVQLAETLDAAGRRAQGQQYADTIWRDTGGDLDASLRRARSIDDPEVRDDVVSRIKTRFNESETIRKANRRQAGERAWGTIFEGGTVDDIDPETWATLGPDQRQQIRTTVAERARGGDIETDWGTYYQLRQEATENPRAFADRDLTQHFGQLADAERKEIIKLQNEAQEQGQAGPEITDVRSTNQMVDDTLRQLGVDPTPKPDSTNADNAVQFRRRFQSELTAFEQQKGGKATPSEKQQILDRLTIEIGGTGGFLGSDIRAYQAGGEQSVPDVPDEFVDDIAMIAGPNEENRVDVSRIQKTYNEITSSMEAEGIPVTRANVRAVLRRRAERALR